MSSDKLLPSAAEMKNSLEQVLALGGLPEAKGWKLLIAMPDYKTKTAGGIELPTEYVDREEHASPVGIVVSMGSSCYQNQSKFPGGAYCKVGDFVVVRPYSGTRLKCHGKEFRFINDDTVEGVVEDPRIIERV